jgi:hypothetical protein
MDLASGQANRLLAEASYPNGFEANNLTPVPPFFSIGEAVGNYLGAIGSHASCGRA